MLEQILLFFMYWLDRLSWSFAMLVDYLWDSKAVLGFLVIWAGTALQKWWGSGWHSAGWAMVIKLATVFQAIRWSLYIVAIIFLLLTLFVAPFEKYKHINAQYTAERKANDELRSAYSKKEEELQLAVSKSREGEKVIAELQDTVAVLQRKSDSVEAIRKFTESSRLMPYIEIQPPTFRGQDNDTSRLVFRYKNTGYSEATLTRAKLLLLLGGKVKDNIDLGTMPMLLIPQQQFSFEIPISNVDRKAVDNGTTSLHIVIEIKYDDKYRGKHVLCLQAPYYRDLKRFGANMTDKQCT